MCQKTRTTQRHLCGHVEQYISLDLCSDYEDEGQCETPPEYWADKEPINFGSKRVKSKCEECRKKEEEEKKEGENQK